MVNYMKKFFLVFLCLIPLKAYGISASSYIVMDSDNNRVLLGSNINDQRLIASTTKIMTCLIAMEYGDLDKTVKVDESVLKAYGSAIYIEVGEEIKLKDLLYGLMLRSGNDAAIMIAKAVAGDMDSFVYLMNEKASSIGMNNTIFYNNHGLEESNGKGNLSTAYDMAILMSYAMKNKTFREITGTKKHIVKTNYKTYSWTNKNKLLHRFDYITGGKTGYTEKARRTLVTSASKDNINLVIVTLNDGNDFKDHITLYNKIFNNYYSMVVLDKNNFNIKQKFYKNAYFVIHNDYFLVLKKKNKDIIKVKYNMIKDRSVSNNGYVGTADVYLNNKLIHQEKIFLRYMNKKEKKSMIKKLFRWLND